MLSVICSEAAGPLLPSGLCSPASPEELQSGQNAQEGNHHHTECLAHAKNEGLKGNHFFPRSSVNSSNGSTCGEGGKPRCERETAALHRDEGEASGCEAGAENSGV